MPIRFRHSTFEYTGDVENKCIYKAIKDYVKENDLEIYLTNSKNAQGDDWNLIDIGPVVVHLMTKEARDFYDLEKLWHGGEKIK